MRLRVLASLAMLLLLPVLAHAETLGGTTGSGAGGGKPVRMNQALVDKLIPILQAEGAATSAFWWDQDRWGMTKQEYTAAKNTLFIAKLDAANEGRVTALPFDDGSRALRRANVAVYRSNRARIDAALQRVHADGCGPACSAASPPPTRRRG